ncbi:GH24 family phage-related lysozyme (muramidase) [Rhizobium sp. BK529]|uniref:lysozyme n=1 Tax=Rhizobium sp. BK529 TaxID=2586983 RepID=UPI00160C183E|nr:lysozyme [Rhizobium sp. BK529]MBB3591743.1 GH24 family phage-related lysozyme (muramidase) [Rhizobium sp. BK529]
MNIVPNWRRVVAISLSFWMQIFGVAVLLYPEVKFRWTEQDSDPVFFWWAGLLLLLAGIIGRLFEQSDSKWREWARIGGVAGLLLVIAYLCTSTVRAAEAPPPITSATEQQTLDIAVPFILKKEGVRLVAYLDGGGVATICGGLTSASGIDVYIGMPAMTMEECLRHMRIKVAEYRRGLHRYFNATTLQTRLPATRDTAYTSLAFNVGIGTAGKSTAVRRLNAGQIADGCEAITWFNKDGGRVIRGLFERRKDEKALCLMGL